MKLIDFFLCMLRGDCVYSIKKFLVYVFTAVVIYLVVYTDKQYYDLLLFIGALLGMREYAKQKYYNSIQEEEPRTNIKGFNNNNEEKG